MKFGRYLAPVAFIAILIMVGGGIWLYLGLTQTPTSAGPQNKSRNFSSLFPFGTSGQDVVETPSEEDAKSSPAPRIRKVTEVPVSAATFVYDTNTLHIRYLELETGHIQQTPVTSLDTVRITNTTIPAASEALWLTASTTLMRFVTSNGEIENFVGNIVVSTTTGTSLEGTFINRYARIAVNAQGVLGVIENEQGSVVEFVNSTTRKVDSVLISPFRSWVPLLSNTKRFVYSAPSASADGALFEIDATGLKKIVSDTPGLMPLVSTSSRYALISSGSRNFMSLTAYNLRTQTILPLSLRTIVPKCAWVPTDEIQILCAVPNEIPVGEYPDDWLLGEVHTDDDLWLVDISTGKRTLAVDFEGYGPFDIAHITVSPDARFATFINRNDQTLWSVELTETPR